MVQPIQSKTNFDQIYSELKRQINDLSGEQVDNAANNIIRLFEHSSSSQNLDGVTELIDLFFTKINAANLGSDQSERIPPLKEMTRRCIFIIPAELHLAVFEYLPVRDMLNMRLVCRELKELIDSCPILQRQIAYNKLVKTQHLTLPVDTINHAFVQNRFAIEIKNDLPLAHLTMELSCTFKRCSHLIVKNCNPNALKQLFDFLSYDNSLLTLTLINCTLDEENISQMLSLLDKKTEEIAPIKIYFCNASAPNRKLNAKLYETSSHRIEIISDEKVHEYGVETFLHHAELHKTVRDFEEAVRDYETKGEKVLEVFDAMNEHAKASITSSIWYSALMNFKSDGSPPLEQIQKDVRKYIAQFPHHPAVINAAHSENSGELSN